MPAPVTRVTAALDRLGIPYVVLPHDEPVYTVEAAARQRGVAAEEMVKSILLRDGAGRYAMTCVLGPDRVDPKAVRACLAAGWKRFSFATAQEILAVTGCVQGAVAPLGLPETVPVLFDVAITRCQRVNISSGDVMAGLELDPRDLIRAAGARIVPIAGRE